MSEERELKQIEETFRNLIERQLIPSFQHLLYLVQRYYELYKEFLEQEVEYSGLRGWVEFKWVRPKKNYGKKYYYYYLRYYDYAGGKKIKRSKYLGKVIPREILEELMKSKRARLLLRELHELERKIEKEAKFLAKVVIPDIARVLISKVEELAEVPSSPEEEETNIERQEEKEKERG